ncbi:hypothetical protein NXU95_13710 [Phocaeicola vulgatus]|nr:hypothetical protein [Phocaeicola vulgatus]
MLRTPIVITEHQTYVPSEDFDIYSFLTAHNVELPGIPADYMGTPQCLAIDSTLTASYYIGATWLVERELPVIVLPKIPNIDYLEMFMVSFQWIQNMERDIFQNVMALTLTSRLLRLQRISANLHHCFWYIT